MSQLTRRGLLKAAGFGSAALVIPGIARSLLAAGEKKKPGPITLTIYNTGDLHDHSGSLARIAGFVKQQKTKHAHTLFVDAGDICNKGEGFMAATQAEGMFHLMSKSGYDAAVLGNWDYTFGKDRILDVCAKHKDMPLVLCNMKWAGKDVERAKHIPRYKLYEFGGVKVSLSGGGSHYKNHYGSPAFPLYHEREGYREILPELKKKADVHLFISHLYDGSDRNLINAWGADAPVVMVGGHTHAKKVWRYGKEGSGKTTLIVKAGWGGQCLGQTTITIDPATKKVVSTQARIIGIGRDWPVDKEIAKLRAWYAGGRKKKLTLVPLRLPAATAVPV